MTVPALLPARMASRAIKKNNIKKTVLAKGFTLVELIIAIAIFGLIALAANQVLSQVTGSSELSDAELEELQNLQRAMLVIERDFQQMVDRVPRIQGQDNELVVTGGEYEFESDAYGIGFVRNGWHNPQLLLPRSSLQNVAYRLQDNQLQRLHTNFVDSVIGTEPKVRVLLEGIEDFKVEVLRQIGDDDDFEWEETVVSTELPLAFKISIRSAKYGNIQRIFAVSA
uniref:type II secretion system minor pseudopilin GspJ n=1 Tax=Ningiella ruwaisensis TaxID=2364274 RepID=UPI001F50130F|nr:type II secretion system minor pseudopilin GspJ [Ningiella ruwaisensis]